MKRALLAVILSLTAAACGGGSDDGGGGGGGGGSTGGGGFSRTCDISSSALHFCISYTGSAYTEASVKTACTGNPGGKIVNSCPTADVAGACTVTTGGESLAYKAYYYAPATSQTVMAACQAIQGTYSSKSADLTDDDGAL
jgi:hypothetical protein